jgi:hypothetical protein
MLLNAFGWWKVSQIAYIASLVLFGLGTITFLAGAFGLVYSGFDRTEKITHESIPEPTKVA